MSGGKCSIEIRQKIVMAKKAFIQKRLLLTNKKLNISMGNIFIKCYLLLYSCETWAINGQNKCKRFLKASWTKRISNIDVLNQLGKKRILLNTIKERSGKMFGHLLRHNSFMTNTFKR